MKPRRPRPGGAPRTLVSALLVVPFVLAACGPGSAAGGVRTTAPSPTSPAIAEPSATPPAIPVTPVAPRPVSSPPAALATPPQAATSVGPIYTSRGHGYDVSYPQCSDTRAPGEAGFSILGLNDGLAFTANPCFTAQWTASPTLRGVYLNSGYDANNYSRTTAQCRQLSQYQNASDTGRAAFAIGCSEAQYSLAMLQSLRVSSEVMVWIDVEVANSWDTVDVELNRLALQAEIYQLNAYGRPVGVYSTFALWRDIVGAWSPDGVVADWVAGTAADSACGAPGFSGHPVWLVQDESTWPGLNVDSDWAC